MRIATGGILHETSTFTPIPTTMREWENGVGLFRGQEIFENLRGANWATWGYMQVAEREGIELIPLLWTFAFPSAPTGRETYEALVEDMIGRLRQAVAEGPIDGVLLELHGSGVAEGVDCIESDQMRRVREVVGPGVPVMAVLDIHSNVSDQMVELADALVIYECYPHTDIAERGLECAELMVRTLREKLQPTMVYRRLPLFWSASRQVTAHPPMDEVIGKVRALKKRSDVLTASISTGFPWADLPFTGAGIVVVTDNDLALAQSLADGLGDWIWENRRRFNAPAPTAAAALDEIEREGKYPAILADESDNSGGGAPGDSTGVLRLFVERRLKDAAILYMADPELARLAHEAGEGATITADVGGKSSPQQGEPIRLTMRVERLNDGVSKYDGPMWSGMTAHLGPSAHLIVAPPSAPLEDGLHIIVTTERMQPLDLAFSRDLGLDCRTLRYIGVKSSAHFRSGFEPIAGKIINVSSPSVHDFRHVTFRRLPRPFFPLDDQ